MKLTSPGYGGDAALKISGGERREKGGELQGEARRSSSKIGRKEERGRCLIATKDSATISHEGRGFIRKGEGSQRGGACVSCLKVGRRGRGGGSHCQNVVDEGKIYSHLAKVLIATGQMGVRSPAGEKAHQKGSD